MRSLAPFAAALAALILCLAAPSSAMADPVTITASIVGALGLTGTAAAVATFVVANGLRLAVSLGLSKLASAFQKQQERQASILTLQSGETPRELIVGRACTGGALNDGANWGGKAETDWEVIEIVVADHLCDGLEGFWLGDEYHEFAGNGGQPAFDWKGTPCLKVYWMPGAQTQYPPNADAAAALGLDMGTARLAGVAHIWVLYLYNDEIFPSGRPTAFRWVIRGAKVYDPRLDSSVGGSGPQRWADPATHVWSENAYLCRYHYTRGVFATGHQGEQRHLLLGRGLGAEQAPVDRAMVAANVCDELVPLKAGGSEARYRVGGVIRADEPFYAVDEMFAAAMAGVIVKPDGTVDIEPGCAKSVPAELEFDDGDLVTGEQIVWKEFESAARRVNTVVPRYTDPALGWKDHAAPVRRVLADILADGKPEEEDLALVLVTSGTQAQRCGEIRRRQARRERAASLTLGPDYACAEDGDWVGYTSERRLAGERAVFRVEAYQVGADYRNALNLREIAASDYDWDPDTDEHTPGAAPLEPTPPPPPLELDDVEAAPMVQSGDGDTQTPAILVAWNAETIDPGIRRIRAEVRLTGTTEVAPTVIEDVLSGEAVVTAGVAGGAAMQVRLIPQGEPGRLSTPSDWIDLTTGDLVSAGSESTPWTGVTDPDDTRPEDNATVGAEIGENLHLPGGAVATAEDVVTSEGTALNTDNVGSKTAAQVVGQIDTLLADVADLAVDYPAVAAAAAAADAAKDLAEDAADDAVAAAGTASGHATTASSAAGVSTTKAGEASISEAGAVAAAAASSVSATSAQSVANSLIPDRPGRRSDFYFAYSGTYANPDLTPTFTLGSVVNVASEGDVLQLVGDTVCVTRGWLAIQTGRTFTADVRAAMVTDLASGAGDLGLGFSLYDAAGVSLGLYPLTVLDTTWTVGEGWRTFSVSVTSATILASVPTAAYVRAIAYGQNTSGSTYQFSILRLRDGTAVAEAVGASSVAISASASASADANLAQQSAILSASLSKSAINTNPAFADYPTTPGIPTGWNAAGATNASGNRVSNPSGGYGYQLTGGAGGNAYALNRTAAGSLQGDQYLVMECDARLDSGALTAAGVLLAFYNAANTLVGTATINFSGDTHSTGAVGGVGTVGQTYRYTKSVRAPAGTDSVGIYSMAHWTSLGSVTSANQITFFKNSIRAATDAEIATGTVLPTAAAQATAASGAIAAAGGLAAYHKFTAAAGGNEAKVEIVATGTDSVVQAVARKVSLVAMTGDAPTAALVLEGNRAVAYCDFQATGKLKYGTGSGWPVGGAARRYSLTDGEYIAFGTGGFAFPTPPIVTPDKSGTGLAARSAGEEYKITAEVTTTGMTARIRKLTPGSPTGYVANTEQSFASGPAFQRDKGTAAVAYDGFYTFEFSYDFEWQYLGPAPWNGSYSNDMLGYSASGELWVYAGGWVSVGTWSVGEEIEYDPGTGSPPVDGSDATVAVAFYEGALANGGGNEFGMTVTSFNGVTITALDQVTWTGASSSGETTATPSGQKVAFLVQPAPENA